MASARATPNATSREVRLANGRGGDLRDRLFRGALAVLVDEQARVRTLLLQRQQHVLRLVRRLGKRERRHLRSRRRRRLADDARIASCQGRDATGANTPRDRSQSGSPVDSRTWRSNRSGCTGTFRTCCSISPLLLIILATRRAIVLDMLRSNASLVAFLCAVRRRFTYWQSRSTTRRRERAPRDFFSRT